MSYPNRNFEIQNPRETYLSNAPFKTKIVRVSSSTKGNNLDTQTQFGMPSQWNNRSIFEPKMNEFSGN